MKDPMSCQDSEVTLPPYGTTYKFQKQLPFGIGVGDKFTAREIEGTITVLEISKNELLVELSTNSSGTWREVWNFEHTIVGFRNGIYKKVLVS